jgi:hypothetical protein
MMVACGLRFNGVNELPVVRDLTELMSESYLFTLISHSIIKYGISC